MSKKQFNPKSVVHLKNPNGEKENARFAHLKEKDVWRIEVVLNGTDVNPYAKWGLRQNPFPQIGRYEYDAHLRHLAALGGEPIPDADYIRKHLKGWDKEFVELCCRNFRKGKYVTFGVFWPKIESEKG